MRPMALTADRNHLYGLTCRYSRLGDLGRIEICVLGNESVSEALGVMFA